MDKFIRYWNQNKMKIIINVVIIVFIIILIQVLNGIAKNNNNNANVKINNEAIVRNPSKPSESVITGQNVPNQETEENIAIIKEFMDYNNAQNYQAAYNLLTEECQKTVYNNDINNYINDYGKKIFASKKTYHSDLWLIGDMRITYKITYYDDNLLATGGNNMNKNFEDYVTVETKDKQKKLNINGFIMQKQINAKKTENNVEVTVGYKNVFQNYETYHITVKNYTQKTIMLNDRKDSKGICLVDKNDVEYTAFLNEIPVERLSLQPAYQKEIDIRFNKMYTLDRKITKMKFKNIILDEETYQSNTNAENIDKIEIIINI